MINIETFFKLHFDTQFISDDKLKLFAQDHLARLNSNNSDHRYDGMFADTTTAYNDYFQALVSENTADAEKQGATVSANRYLKQFRLLVRQKEGIVRGTWGVDSAVYQEFYPLGITEYNKATRANIDSLMDRFIMAANDHAAELPAGFAADFAGLRNAYGTARAEQLRKMSEFLGDKSLTRDKRKALVIRLQKNLLLIAAEFAGRPEVAGAYFNQSIVRRK